MPGRLDFILRANADYIEDQHRRWLADPSQVPEDWALFFSGMAFGERRDAPARADGGVFSLVQAYREHGHLLSRLDPIGDAPDHHPYLELSAFGLTEDDLDRDVEPGPFQGEFRGTLRQLLERLQQTYCGTLGAEFMGLSDPVARTWWATALEQDRGRAAITDADRIVILRALLAADGFEQFLHARYTGQKRFSLEGAGALIPMLERLVRDAASLGVEQLTIGMPHRGRINVLANILRKPLDVIFSEFEANFAPPEIGGLEDVKYHLGYSSTQTGPDGREIHLNLHYNPSHLEYVNPVVLGSIRARQDVMSDAGRDRGVPVLLHGDAAFAGEGIVGETMMLAQLPHYDVGGTLHIIVNNQVGFTTLPEDVRIGRYPTAIARAVDAPVLHVNGDDPEAAVHAISLALAYRMRFKRDVVLDLWCYRRHGHNEMDDPTFTQPVMYRRIADHTPVARAYAEQLQARGVLDAPALERMQKELDTHYRGAHQRASSEVVIEPRKPPGGLWTGLDWAGEDLSAETRVPRETLEQVLHGATRLPEDFRPHRKITAFHEDRRLMFLEDRIDWSLGEALAYGSLLLEGRNVRLTGQDAGRGTFTHRHAVLRDREDGRRHVPLQHLAPEQGRFEIVDTMLSEAAVLGFEYGYSTCDPHTLVVWEAQFGDFANVAQVIIDQFVASGETKWGRMSGLTLLLPHGYEGQGPEHSSARLERFLELCADRNLQVVHPTTPAQCFHALRRQLHRLFRKPLVVMSPKSLLRHKRAVSPLSEFTDGAFRPVIADESAGADAARVLLVSGKFFYTLLEAREEAKRKDIAIVRVEQLHPFPEAELREALARHPQARDVRWVQEEPENMGGWRNLRHRLEAVLPEGAALRVVARPAASSPATGYYSKHQRQERELLEGSIGGSSLEGAPARRRGRETKGSAR